MIEPTTAKRPLTMTPSFKINKKRRMGDSSSSSQTTSRRELQTSLRRDLGGSGADDNADGRRRNATVIPRMSPSSSLYNHQRHLRKQTSSSHRRRDYLHRCNIKNGNLVSPSPLSCRYTSSGDRFIPNRRRIDINQARSHLLSSKEGETGEGTNTDNDIRDTQHQREMKQYLRRAFFGQNGRTSSMLGLTGPSILSPMTAEYNIKSSAIHHGLMMMEDPLMHDLLGTTTMMTASNPYCRQRRSFHRHRKVNTSHNMFAHNSRGLVPSSCGDPLRKIPLVSAARNTAVADEDITGTCDFLFVGFRNPDGWDLSAFINPSDAEWVYNEVPYGNVERNKEDTMSCLKVSEGARAVAIGSYGKVTVWDVANQDYVDITIDMPRGFVSAMEWYKCDLLFSACDSVVRITDTDIVTERILIDVSKQKHVSNLKYQNSTHTLACAGNGMVSIWDTRYVRKPMKELCHDGVHGMDFCPSDGHLLATAGKDGVKIWDTAKGTLKTTLPILGQDVTNALWSPYRNEILSSYENYLSLWSIDLPSGDVHRVKEWEMLPEQSDYIGEEQSVPRSTGRILSLEHLSNGKVVAVDESGFHWASKPFQAPISSTKKIRYEKVPEFSVIR